jgi:hypothetical protein
MLHAWFSTKMASDSGTAIYLDANGAKVEVTSVAPCIDHGLGWDDVEYRGLVKTYLRPGRTGNAPICMAFLRARAPNTKTPE